MVAIISVLLVTMLISVSCILELFAICDDHIYLVFNYSRSALITYICFAIIRDLRWTYILLIYFAFNCTKSIILNDVAKYRQLWACLFYSASGITCDWFVFIKYVYKLKYMSSNKWKLYLHKIKPTIIWWRYEGR